MVFTLLVSLPGHIHRHDFDRAFVAWYKNPTPQNKAVLRREMYRNRIVWLSVSAELAFAVVAGAFSAYWAVRQMLRSLARVLPVHVDQTRLPGHRGG